MKLRFEWDRGKAAGIYLKHGVGFDEASTVFRDPLTAISDDVEHSGDEPRALVVGHSIGGRLLVVSFVEKPDGSVRAISARVGTGRKRTDYEKGQIR